MKALLRALSLAAVTCAAIAALPAACTLDAHPKRNQDGPPNRRGVAQPLTGAGGGSSADTGRASASPPSRSTRSAPTAST